MDALPRDIASVRRTRLPPRAPASIRRPARLHRRSKVPARIIRRFLSVRDVPCSRPSRLLTPPRWITRDAPQVLPDDPADQLELAHRIANAAFVAQTQSLAKERDALKEQCAEMQMRSKQLERRVASMEDELHDAADKAAMAMEERDKLTAEKTALINTVKKLNREVAKLDAFKRNLAQTLADAGEDGAGAGDAAGERLVTSVLASAESNPSNGFSPQRGSSSRYGGSRTSASERSPERVSRRVSAANSPAPGGGASPLGGARGGREGPADADAANGPKVDGKAFFREARARLSYERFSEFLQNIKALNAHKQTRAETLARADDIFGESNKDLFRTFETLLVKHLPK